MPKLLDLNLVCKDLPEIYSSKVLDRKRFSNGGLFSQQVFGPLKNYTCQCGTYYGASKAIAKCEKCNVEILHSRERRKRFAKILLPIPVINPVFYDLVVHLGGNTLKKHIDSLKTNEELAVYINKNGEEDPIIGHDSSPELNNGKYYKFEKIEAIYEMIKKISYDLSDSYAWKYVYNNIDKLILREIPILPPDLRPISSVISKDSQFRADTINDFYGNILTKKVSMRETFLNITKSKRLYYEYFKLLQKDVDNLYNTIISKLSKKEGLIRGNILGKRSDFSARAIIAPEPTLKLDECCLPYLMVLELFKIQIAKRLVELQKFKFINNAIDYIDKCIEIKDESLIKICEEIVNGDVCMLNRQPSLHKLGLLGFKIKVSLGDVIKIHPLVCAGYNADFDGDQMAVYIPITKETKEETTDKVFSIKNLTNPTDYSLAPIPSQDIVIGIYLLTDNRFSYLNSEVEYKGSLITTGRKIFNDCLPEDYKIINERVNKDILIKTLSDINEKYPEDITASVLDKIKEIGFFYATMYGLSLSLKDIVTDKIYDYREKIYNKKSHRERLENLNSNETKEFLRENFKYSDLIDSGARGSWDQAKQIILSRGYISNFRGEILPSAIKGNLLEGLSPKEFFLSTHGCRKGLLDTALNTGVAGFLSRKLIFEAMNFEISRDEEDCGTNDYLNIYIPDEKKALSLILRWYKKDDNEEMITKENYKDIIGKTILLRSPIYCKSEKVCHKCYGDLYKILHDGVAGVIAAQALGEVGTQLVLRVFHLSGAAQIKDSKDGKEDEDMKQEDIIGDLSSVSKILHVKDKTLNEQQIVDKLYKIYSDSRRIQHIHYEVVVAQMMWIGYTKWRLHPKRAEMPPQFISIQSVPERENWLLGLAFGNQRKNLILGLLRHSRYTGKYDSILRGKRI